MLGVQFLGIHRKVGSVEFLGIHRRVGSGKKKVREVRIEGYVVSTEGKKVFSFAFHSVE